jgi:dihydrofolate synthase / folylpolyglutamate synthase
MRNTPRLAYRMHPLHYSGQGAAVARAGHRRADARASGQGARIGARLARANWILVNVAGRRQALVDEFSGYHAAVAWIKGNIRGPADRPEPRPLHTLEERHLRRFLRMRGFLAQLGHPERAFVAMHVAGTSGKGSTCAMLAAIGHASGRRTGLHVSPYLQTPLEKLAINDRLMNIRRFVALVERFRAEVAAFNATSPEGPLRYGEVWVALTFAAYAAELVDLGIVEVGSGGRWDYTNVIVPDVAVINRIGMDHVRTLGPTIVDIAGHKAGIIKPGVPVVVAEQPPEALAVILAEAEAQAAPVRLAGRDFVWRITGAGPTGSHFRYEDRDVRWDDLFVPLLGEYQVANAALAVAAARCLRRGPAIGEDAVRQGLASVRFGGRLERMQEAPEVLLDGAHNAQKAEALAGALRQMRQGRRLVLVLGILASHAPNGIVEVLAPLADAVVCTATKVIGKAARPPEELAALCRGYGARVETRPGPVSATRRAIALAGKEGVVCVTGSLYLVGAARSLWHTEAELLRAAWQDAEDPLPAQLAVV